jgi:hypothetical protein
MSCLEALSRQSRLKCRYRQALLQRSARSRPPRGRGADHRQDRRDFPAWQAHGVASTPAEIGKRANVRGDPVRQARRRASSPWTRCWRDNPSSGSELLTESKSSDRKLKPPPDLFRHQNSALAPGSRRILLVFAGFICRNGLFDILERQPQLLGIELLRTSAKLRALELAQKMARASFCDSAWSRSVIAASRSARAVRRSLAACRYPQAAEGRCRSPAELNQIRALL